MPASRFRLAGWRRSAAVAVAVVIAAGSVAAGNEQFNGDAPPSWVRSPDEQTDASTTSAPTSTSRPDLLPDWGDAGPPGRWPPRRDGTGGRGATDGTDPSRAAGPVAGDAAVLPPPPRSGPATAPPAPPTPPPIVARPVPGATPPAPPPDAPRPPWAESTRRTAAGYISTDVGCAGNRSAGALDTFFAGRRGPVLGLDYQHVVPLGGDRFLWLFQDAFLDHSGGASRLDQAAFAHNVAMVQEGACFTLIHRGSAHAPASFEAGTGERPLRSWFWPMGGDVVGDSVHVFWVQMRKVADPGPGDGLGWDPAATWLATYDARSLARTSFRPAPDPGVNPIYGYAVASDEQHTYLFGNTFDQNLADQGGFYGGPHSARLMYLARVPRGRLTAAPEYWTGTGWSRSRRAATPISDRFPPENPMQPRYVDGRWVAATKAGGYWGDDLVIDVARDPWGPWHTAERRALHPAGRDPLMNTYHAHLMPWLADGALVVSVSQNARNMLAHAWPRPERYRPQFLAAALGSVPNDDLPAPTTTVTPTTPTRPTTPTTPTTPPTTPPTTSATTATTSTTSSTTTTTSPTTSSTATSTTAPACPPPSSTPTPSAPTTSTSPTQTSTTLTRPGETTTTVVCPGG